MTRKKQRAIFIFVGLLILAIAVGMAIWASRDSFGLFIHPSEIKAEYIQSKKYLKIGGLVVNGSKKIMDSGLIKFALTDCIKTINIEFKGILPDLFAEGEQIIAIGKINKNNILKAEKVLAKHDENYQPVGSKKENMNKQISQCKK